jgi:hypothetical protein
MDELVVAAVGGGAFFVVDFEWMNGREGKMLNIATTTIDCAHAQSQTID